MRKAFLRRLHRGAVRGCRPSSWPAAAWLTDEEVARIASWPEGEFDRRRPDLLALCKQRMALGSPRAFHDGDRDLADLFQWFLDGSVGEQPECFISERVREAMSMEEEL